MSMFSALGIFIDVEPG